MVKKIFLMGVPLSLLGFYIVMNPMQSTRYIHKDQIEYEAIRAKIEQFNVERFIARIEKYTNQTNIKVYKIKHLFKKIEFELHGDVEDIIKFLFMLESKESLVQIKSLQMYVDKIKLNLEVGKKLNRFAMKPDFNRSQNPFIFNITNAEFTLYAIIENSAIIDQKLVHIDDIYKMYKVYKIEDKRVVLRNKQKQIILRIDDV